MTSEYITQTITDGTVGDILMHAALAILLFLVGVAFYLIVMRNYKRRADTKQYYYDTVIAFKVGYIHKHAKENNIELIAPPKSDLMKQLEEEVSKDINTT